MHFFYCENDVNVTKGPSYNTLYDVCSAFVQTTVSYIVMHSHNERWFEQMLMIM